MLLLATSPRRGISFLMRIEPRGAGVDASRNPRARRCSDSAVAPSGSASTDRLDTPTLTVTSPPPALVIIGAAGTGLGLYIARRFVEQMRRGSG